MFLCFCVFVFLCFYTGIPKDEHLPKAVEFFSSPPRVYPDSVPMFMRSNRPPLRAESITAGGSCVYIVSKNDHMLYFFGRFRGFRGFRCV